ncbi:PREDICTED: glutamate receptor ionotropic, kainate 5-like [Nicrophorus vespilloides]|uniref:Glutamate receptor ionotropic, kainate 5-like n=1 Tax=Nicrophorus vespilloides TaxID=110193 RepID=A0ABM1MX97_NICVS|nr:PREDICTED: glutamate receptor ionotropic, kainate 5-like [Nicrophorus vespilloides]
MNLVKHQKQPTKVNAFFCTSKANIVKVSKKFSTIEVRSIIYSKFENEINLFKPLEHQLFLLDYSCPYSKDLLEMVNENKLFNYPLRWIILNTLQLDEKYKIFINSRVYLVDGKVVSLYKITEEKPYIYNQIYNGNKDNFHTLSDVKDRADLQKTRMNISIAYIYDETFNNFESLKPTLYDAFCKHNYILMLSIVAMLNVTPNYHYFRSWGVPDKKTGMYDGVVGDLQREQSELGATVCFFLKDRFKILEYIAPSTPTNEKFIFRGPPLSAVSNIYALPFNFAVWIACVLLFLMTMFVVYVIIKWEWFTSKDELIMNPFALKPTLVDVIQMEIGAMCQQGSETEPMSRSGRIATFFIFLSFMFLYTAYSANIVVLLQATSNSITTLEDLVTSRISLGVDDTVYNKFFFEIENGETQLAIRRLKVMPPNNPKNYIPLRVGVEKIRTEFFGFHAECDPVYKIVSATFSESEKCGLQEIKYWSFSDPWVPVRKNTTYKELIKIGYRHLMERGIQNRVFSRIYAKKPICQNSGANFVSVSIRDCYFALLIYVCGLTIAVLMFLLELFSKKLKQKFRTVKY